MLGLNRVAGTDVRSLTVAALLKVFICCSSTVSSLGIYNAVTIRDIIMHLPSPILDAPRIHPSTKFIQYAQPGMKAEFELTVEARPTTADFMWFWIGDDTGLSNKARNIIITQSSSRGKQRSRRSIAPLKAISTSVSPWINRVKQTSSTSGDNRMKFALAIREVTEADFGIYMCQVNHKAGNREFYFELKRQSGKTCLPPFY